MIVKIFEGIEGAQQAKGTVVIIDVLRAATVSAYLLDKGVSSITPVSTKEEAFELRKKDADYLLVGEEKGIKIDGFDIGNSPLEISLRNNLEGNKAIHRSSTGTQGLVHAKNAEEIIFGSFVTAQAIIDYLNFKLPKEVTFVPMYAIDDHLFAEYMQAKLLGKKYLSKEEIKQKVGEEEWIKNHFLNPDNLSFPEEDFHLALDHNVFDFFPIVKNGVIVKSK